MFVGHWAPALAAAGASERAPNLGLLFVAGQLVDWGFFMLAVAGVERMRVEPGFTALSPFDLYHMPYTHSLLGTLGWALALAAVVWLGRRDWLAGAIAGAVALSHWPLDWLVHAPDLTIAGGGPKLGFGLWDAPTVAIPLELGLIAAGFVFYLRRTVGPVLPPVVLALALLAAQLVHWFGPAPAGAGPGLYLFALGAFAFLTLIAFWVGWTRRPRRRLV